jgi:hypothetical protein
MFVSLFSIYLMRREGGCRSTGLLDTATKSYVNLFGSDGDFLERQASAVNAGAANSERPAVSSRLESCRNYSRHVGFVEVMQL